MPLARPGSWLVTAHAAQVGITQPDIPIHDGLSFLEVFGPRLDPLLCGTNLPALNLLDGLALAGLLGLGMSQGADRPADLLQAADWGELGLAD